MKKIALLLTLLAIVAVQVVCAQSKQITGTVRAADQTSLPGVSIVVRGTTSGTITDVDGKYSINVPADAKELVFSFIGMKTKIVSIDTSSVIDVQLEADVVSMDEVLVTGYGTTTREANTGSVGTVKSEELADVPELSFDKMLGGKVAGVQVTSTSGQPGSSSQIRIRGISSLTAGNEPLYVVDGIPIISSENTDYIFANTSNPLSMINPNDIENITVLKDAAAASIYGSRAANGVILITTKSGKIGKSTVSARASYGVTSLANDNGYGTMNPEQLVTYMRDAVTNAGLDPDDPTNGSYYIPRSLLSTPQTNWMDALTRLGNVRDVEVSVNGGDAKTRHYTSAAYSETEGVFYGVDYSRFQIRSNIDHSLNDKLKVAVRTNLGYNYANDVAMQSLYYANPVFAGMLILPWTPLMNEDGTYNLSIPENANTNPRATAEYDDQWEKQLRGSTTGNIEWKPVKGLTLSTNNSAEVSSSEGRRYWSPDADYAGTATLQTHNARYIQLTSSNTVSYNTYLMDVHSFRILAGQEATDHTFNYYYMYSPDVDPAIPYPNTSASDADEGDYQNLRWTMLSFFGNFEYNYNSKYYLKASLRSDGSSKFGANNRWGTFYSVSASWNAHEEAFLQSVSAINTMKLRLSYGVNGNDNIGTYEHWGVYSSDQYNGVVGMSPAQPKNPDLTWEVNTAYNAGLDFGLFDRVSGSFEVYKRLTTDMLLNTNVSRTSGFATLRRNIGSLSNTGWEALVNYDILQGGDFEWSISANIAHNKSKILDLGDETEFANANNARILHRVGESLYQFYLYDYAGVNPVNGEALWYTEGEDGERGPLTNVYANARRFLAGSPEPDYIGGINTELSWKGISLSIALEYKLGAEVLIEENRYLNSDGYEWGSNQANTMLDYWKEPGDIVRNPKPIANNTTNSAGFYNTRWLYDGDYLRIKNITLGYSLPKKIVNKINLEDLRIYGSAVNAYTFHNVDYWDPERGVDGTGFGIYPQTKSFVVGIDIKF